MHLLSLGDGKPNINFAVYRYFLKDPFQIKKHFTFTYK